MKKILFFVLLACMCQISFAQDFDDLFKEYKHRDGVEYVKVGGFVMGAAKMFLPKEEKRELEGMNVKSVTILSLEDGCTPQMREQFAADVNNLKVKGYEDLLTAKEDKEVVHLWGKGKEDVIKDLVIFTQESDECALIRLTGKFSLKTIMERYSQNKE